MSPDTIKGILGWMDNADRHDDEDTGVHRRLTLPEALFRKLKEHLGALLPLCPEGTLDICCLDCDHDFEARIRHDGQCPNCGHHYTWECSQGHDNVEFCTPLWDSERP